jgi:hypothetical protein
LVIATLTVCVEASSSNALHDELPAPLPLLELLLELLLLDALPPWPSSSTFRAASPQPSAASATPTTDQLAHVFIRLRDKQ